MKIDGLSALVTGGASGLGQATADVLAAAGARVAALDLAFDGATKAGHLQLTADVADEAQVTAALDTAEAANGAVRILVNCAGISEARRVLGRDGVMPLGHFKRMVDVHLVGTFNVARLMAERLAKADPINADGERGVIVNTSSIQGLEGTVGAVSYAAAKAGIAGMTLPMAREFSRHGIRVVAIAPGVFETPMALGLGEEAMRDMRATVPFPTRLGAPSEFGRLVKQICENAMLNGEVIRLDAAYRMGT
jgi:NAD(P)-dependent dehydrogenase (short-subunit alcohol dehydrogenase family)